ncbi:unnamed protein product [Cuscuta epithymum]|uniref:RRM domain-containing protein n=1 Tax=Cuscuta epithymum TaxID=186058 RepID=A0AAV0G5H0_9ASTE|nr:unnamed protein product [Cuscuta epithymum]
MVSSNCRVNDGKKEILVEVLAANMSKRLRNAWTIPNGTTADHALTDVTLFSCSMPILPHKKLIPNDSETRGQLIDDSTHRLSGYHVEGGSSSLFDDDDDDTRMLGNFLPGDEDELLAGITYDFEHRGLPSNLEDLEDDLFGSGGGIEIELDRHDNNLLNGFAKLSISEGISGSSIGAYGLSNGSGEHPYGEHPSRTLFVRNINSSVEDSELKCLFEQFGDIRALYTACKHRGFVMISYYDIRAARIALRVLQNKPLGKRKLDIHFSIPKENPSDKDVNQGTLVVFNLDPSVSNDHLQQIFGAYGEVKEIRETPHKQHHKFIEFYDVRAAEAALKALNKSDIAGKRIKLELSRPGGARKNLMQQGTQDLEHDDVRSFGNPVGSPIANSPPGSWPNFGSPVEPNQFHNYSTSACLTNISPINNNISGLTSVFSSSTSNPMKIAPIGKDHGKKLGSSSVPVSFDDSNPSVIGTLSGPQFLWGSPVVQSEKNVSSSIWSKPSMGRLCTSNAQGQGCTYSHQEQGYPYSHRHNSFLGSHHHVGSAPSGIPLERHFELFPESPETTCLSRSYNNGGSLGGTFIQSGSLVEVEELRVASRQK